MQDRLGPQTWIGPVICRAVQRRKARGISGEGSETSLTPRWLRWHWLYAQMQLCTLLWLIFENLGVGVLLPFGGEGGKRKTRPDFPPTNNGPRAFSHCHLTRPGQEEEAADRHNNESPRLTACYGHGLCEKASVPDPPGCRHMCRKTLADGLVVSLGISRF